MTVAPILTVVVVALVLGYVGRRMLRASSGRGIGAFKNRPDGAAPYMLYSDGDSHDEGGPDSVDAGDGGDGGGGDGGGGDGGGGGE